MGQCSRCVGGLGVKFGSMTGTVFALCIVLPSVLLELLRVLDDGTAIEARWASGCPEQYGDPAKAVACPPGSRSSVAKATGQSRLWPGCRGSKSRFMSRACP
jgi:hypothetical protein